MDLFLLIEFPDAMVFSRSGSNIGSPRISELQLAYLKSLCGQKSVASQEKRVHSGKADFCASVQVGRRAEPCDNENGLPFAPFVGSHAVLPRPVGSTMGNEFT
jgi:hypothetical protein